MKFLLNCILHKTLAMCRLTFLVFSLLVFSCNQKQRPRTEIPQVKFYDFNLRIDISSPFYGVDTQFLYINAGHYVNEHKVIDARYFKPNTLYIIPIFENLNKVGTKDTFRVRITDAQIDTLYALVTDLFDVNKKNIILDSVGSSQVYNDGLSAFVVLDLMFRGNKFMTQFNFGDEEEENKGAHLYKYLLKLKNNHQPL